MIEASTIIVVSGDSDCKCWGINERYVVITTFVKLESQALIESYPCQIQLGKTNQLKLNHLFFEITSYLFITLVKTISD